MNPAGAFKAASFSAIFGMVIPNGSHVNICVGVETSNSSGVSKNREAGNNQIVLAKSSILMGFSIINYKPSILATPIMETTQLNKWAIGAP